MFIREIWGKFASLNFRNFLRFQNSKKVNSVNLSQISLLNIWLLVLIWRHYTNLSLPRAFLQSSCCYVLWNCFKRSPYFMSVISTITPKPIPKVQTKASILKFSQQNLFLKMFFKLFHLWLTQFLFYIFPHCSTFFFINEIFKGIFF